MQKNISSRGEPDPGPAGPAGPSKEPAKGPREVLAERLGFRGMEVLNNAEAQFPAEARMVVSKLAELIGSGELRETVDGGKLLALFRSVGLPVRMETRISVEKDGKFVSLGEKLSQEG